jgi:hypothetical protein
MPSCIRTTFLYRLAIKLISIEVFNEGTRTVKYQERENCRMGSLVTCTHDVVDSLTWNRVNHEINFLFEGWMLCILLLDHSGERSFCDCQGRFLYAHIHAKIETRERNKINYAIKYLVSRARSFDRFLRCFRLRLVHEIENSRFLDQSYSLVFRYIFFFFMGYLLNRLLDVLPLTRHHSSGNVEESKLVKSPLECTLQGTIPCASRIKPTMNTEDAFEQFGQQFLAQFGPLPSSRKRKAAVALESPINKRAKGQFRMSEYDEDSGHEWNGIAASSAQDTSESGMPLR